MKKFTPIWVLSLLLTVGCGDTKQAINNEQNQETRPEITNNETLFITKVTAAFHKIVEDDQAWKTLQIVIEDNLVMKNETIKDDLLPNAYLTIRDDMIMGLNSLRNIDLNGIRFSDRLIKEYNALYKEGITYRDIEKKLYKLHFAIPKFAISNPDKWKKEGRPISAKGYEFGDKKLDVISKEKAEKVLGAKKLNHLMEMTNVKSPNFYTIENKDGVHIIAGNQNRGALASSNNNKVIFKVFTINDYVLYNTITIQEGKDETTYFQKNLVNQTFIPTPPTCKGFYVFDCDSQAFADHRAQNQAIADATCETLWECIPCCSNGMGIIYMSMIYEPQPLKCKKHEAALEVISLYPSDWVNNNT